MKHINNIKIVKILKILNNIIINNNDKIINHNFNFFIDNFTNKSLYNK